MYISIDKEFLEKNKQIAWDAGVKMSGDENISYLWEETAHETVSDWELTSDNMLYVSVENDLGYFSVEAKITDEMLMQIVEIAVKRLNKLKNVMESLK